MPRRIPTRSLSDVLVLVAVRMISRQRSCILSVNRSGSQSAGILDMLLKRRRKITGHEEIAELLIALARLAPQETSLDNPIWEKLRSLNAHPSSGGALARFIAVFMLDTSVPYPG